MSSWSPSSWQQEPAKQEPTYPAPERPAAVVAEMSRLPPLVTSWEVEALRVQLAAAARGDSFLLQGRDCAEIFDECDSGSIAAKLKILLQMSLVMIHATRRPVIRVGRIAGQYTKPRSVDLETQGDVTLPSYRGDLVNRFFTSHEGLSLLYEQAQTRQVPRREGWYNLSTHYPWIGMRTADIDGAHVEYFRGIRNPISVKIGPGMTEDWLRSLVGILDPDKIPGRLTCAFDVHERMGSRLGGVHLELTGDNVTECIGGARGLDERDLKRDYRTRVDPRLNYEQALEIAMIIAKHLRR